MRAAIIIDDAIITTTTLTPPLQRPLRQRQQAATPSLMRERAMSRASSAETPTMA